MRSRNQKVEKCLWDTNLYEKESEIKKNDRAQRIPLKGDHLRIGRFMQLITLWPLFVATESIPLVISGPCTMCARFDDLVTVGQGDRSMLWNDIQNQGGYSNEIKRIFKRNQEDIPTKSRGYSNSDLQTERRLWFETFEENPNDQDSVGGFQCRSDKPPDIWREMTSATTNVVCYD